MSFLKTTAIQHLNGSSPNINLDSSGRVGIGTPTPSTPLEVKGSGDTLIRVTGGLGNAKGVEFYKGSGSPTQLYNVSDNLIVYTGGLNTMTINSSGCVAIPYQPSFRAAATDNGSFTSGTIPYSQVITNVGSCYNASTYRFTAPVAGVYIFEAHFLSNRNTTAGDHGFDFYVNGSGVKRIYHGVSGGTSVHAEARGTLITYLNAADYVTIYMYGNAKTGIVGNPTHCQFAGFFLG